MIWLQFEKKRKVIVELTNIYIGFTEIELSKVKIYNLHYYFAEKWENCARF